MAVEQTGQTGERSAPASAVADDPLLAEAVQRLVAAFHPERIYLFGSRARGDHRDDSDYDIMVVVAGSDLAPHHRAQHAHVALRGVRIGADILVWTRPEFDRFLPVAGSLAATILREGRPVYAG